MLNERVARVAQGWDGCVAQRDCEVADRMFRKLAIVAVVMLAVPLAFLVQDKYVSGLGPYGVVSLHSVEHYGYGFFVLTLLSALGLLIAGMIHPKISLWWGTRTRRRVCIVYAFMVAVSVLGVLEVRFLSTMVYAHDSAEMRSFYHQLSAGTPVEQIKKLARSHGKHIGYGYRPTQNMMRKLDVPEQDTSRYFVEFSYPGLWRLPRVVVETTAPPEQAGAVAKQVYWVDDW